jgi:hypothetical protein
MIKKIRHVHIPKTAGSALNAVIYQALGLRPTHISSIIMQSVDTEVKSQLVYKSKAYKFARNVNFLSGHISYSDMKSLDGDYIFSTLRDPKQRLVSLFTYYESRVSSGRLPNDRSIQPGLLNFLNKTKPSNGILRRLCNDFITAKGYEYTDLKVDSPFTLALTIRALKRFDAIYFCPIQDTLNDLSMRSLIPECQEIVKNTSIEGIELGNLGLQQTFFEMLEKLTYLDSLTITVASDLFPSTIKQKELSNDEFVKYLENRFDCKFMTEF